MDKSHVFVVLVHPAEGVSRNIAAFWLEQQAWECRDLWLANNSGTAEISALWVTNGVQP